MRQFTDLTLAMDHAQDVANSCHGAQRRAAYLTQEGHFIKVYSNIPRSGQQVMATVRPK